jgi:TonB family protein
MEQAMLVTFLAAAVASASSGQVGDARAERGPSTPQLLTEGPLVAPDDYPFEAIKLKQQGTVGVRLDVDKTGAVSGCTVTASSGSAALDTETCRLLRRKAKFRPALDSRQKRVPGTFTQKITWRLGDDALPIRQWTSRMVYDFAPDGQLSACRTQRSDSPAPLDCLDSARRVRTRADPDWPKGVKSLVFEERFEPGGTVDPSGGSVPAGLISRQMVSLMIGADGKLSDCRLVQAIGEPVAVSAICDFFAEPFEPPVDSQGNPTTVAATFSLSRYFVIQR